MAQEAKAQVDSELTREQLRAAFSSGGPHERQLMNELVEKGGPREAAVVAEILHFFPGSFVEETGSMDPVGRDHPLARASDPGTSHMAQEQLRIREGDTTEIRPNTHRHRALECFAQEGPLIAEDVKVITGIDGIWKRVSDLKEMQYIERTGQTKTSREGREGDVYRITEAGLAAYARLGACS